MKISAKRQISLPKKIMAALNLKPGDEIEFQLKGDSARLVPIRTIKVPREQAWFWTPEWQAKEMEAEEDLRSGEYKDFENVKDLLKDLHSEDLLEGLQKPTCTDSDKGRQTASSAGGKPKTPLPEDKEVKRHRDIRNSSHSRISTDFQN
ncbi:MAG: AbrB/MazE/SpoVT family DNA-binding domain-containing protein [Deltaproteobacteria bacterium]|nr:AbrB/MazE/SpoVT family DNA-binding domain-containing protein [Deltaproteobacteria bacterium]